MKDGPNEMETLMGGMELTVRLLDGTEQTVRIRQLPIKLMPLYMASMEVEPKQVELFCDKPSGWSDLLTNDSFELIVVEGTRINRDFFQRWKLRKEERAAGLPARDLAKEMELLGQLQERNPSLFRELLSRSGIASPDKLPS